jgi:hypothetical protein
MNASIDDVEIFTKKITRLCLGFGASVTSWWRTVHHNSVVGGKTNSKHIVGLAVDVVLDPLEDRNDFLYSVHQKGLYYLIEKDHIHIQSVPPDVNITIGDYSLPKPAAAPAGGQTQGGIPS